ncbi:MAG: hypothetical protein ACOYD4_08170 [Solirubrobacterales bacterium]
MRLRLPQRRERTYDGEDLTPFERAAARFNASEAGRTVCGLVRTLGDPRVSVGALAGAGEEARVTVAWELTWYQWRVDLGERPGPVRELARGREIVEIDYAARQWNASATAEGRIVIAAHGR